MPFHSFHMGLLLTYSTGLYVPPSCKKNLRTFKSLTYLSFYQNADMLQATLKNMSQYGGFMFWSYRVELMYIIPRLLFWFVSDELYNAQQLVADADEHINKAIDRGMPAEDIAAIQTAFMHLYVSLTRL